MTATQHSKLRSAPAWVVALAILLSPLLMQTAQADSRRDQARKHYEAGRDLYSAGEYKAAIREFETANKLAPSPVLDFNIGLARERLGQLREALAHYRTYIASVPNAANRASVEAKIQSLERELAASKPTTAQPVVHGKSASSTTIPTPKKAAAGVNPAMTGTTGPAEQAPIGAEPGGSKAFGGSTAAAAATGSAPPSGQPAYQVTGDTALDRAAQINLAEIRDLRADAIKAAEAVAPPTANHQDFGKKKAKPAYKKWWFWAIVGVSTIILIDLARGEDAGAQPTPIRGPLLLRF